MFVPFLICVMMIGTVGPGHHEGGFKAMEQHGAKPAIERAWDNRKPVDYSKMNR